MTRANRERELGEINAELKNQGWEVQRTAQGHWKARPPDPTKSIIHYSASDDTHAQKNILRDLRRSGFTWPPPPKTPRSTALTNEPLFNEFEDQDEMPRSANASSQPQEPQVQTLTLVAQAKTMDQVFHDLKEAKGYLVLMDEHQADCKKALEAAQHAFNEAEIERAKAVETLRQKKAEFDEMFAEANVI